MNEPIELTGLELDQVTGGLGNVGGVISILNYILEFGTGFIDGVNAAN